MSSLLGLPAEKTRDLPSGLPDKYRNRQRRFSVSAESDHTAAYNFKPPVHPKSEEVRKRIDQALAGIFLFAGIDEDQKRAIIDALVEKTVKAGDVIIEQDKQGDFFYIIESGKYEVYKKSKTDQEPVKVFEYNNSGSFGELALMYNCPRLATVKAFTDGVLWCVDRATFRHIIIETTARKRRMYEDFLYRVPILGTLSAAERSQLADCLEPQRFHDGDYIIRQGDAPDKFYLIEKGEAVATQTLAESGEEVIVGRMSVGQYFGERALITNEPRAANVKAVGDLSTVAIDRASFERLLGESRPAMLRRIVSYLSADRIKLQEQDGDQSPVEECAQEESPQEPSQSDAVVQPPQTEQQNE